MTDVLTLAVVLGVVVDPFAAVVAATTLMAPADKRGRTALVVWGVAGAAVALVVAALVADAVLDWLDVSPPSALLAAGCVVFIAAADAVWRGAAGRVRAAPDRSAVATALFPFAVPVLAGPAALTGVVAWAADRGAAETIGAIVVVLAVAGIAVQARRASVDPRVARVGGTFMGAAAMLVAFDMVRDGVFGI